VTPCNLVEGTKALYSHAVSVVKGLPGRETRHFPTEEQSLCLLSWETQSAMEIEVFKDMRPCRLVIGYRYLSTLCYLDDGSNEPLRNIVSDQSIWCYSPEKISLQICFSFFYKLSISKNVSR